MKTCNHNHREIAYNEHPFPDCPLCYAQKSVASTREELEEAKNSPSRVTATEVNSLEARLNLAEGRLNHWKYLADARLTRMEEIANERDALIAQADARKMRGDGTWGFALQEKRKLEELLATERETVTRIKNDVEEWRKHSTDQQDQINTLEEALANVKGVARAYSAECDKFRPQVGALQKDLDILRADFWAVVKDRDTQVSNLCAVRECNHSLAKDLNTAHADLEVSRKNNSEMLSELVKVRRQTDGTLREEIMFLRRELASARQGQEYAAKLARERANIITTVAKTVRAHIVLEPKETFVLEPKRDEPA